MNAGGIYENIRTDVKNLGVSDIIPQDLQDQTIGPFNIAEYRKKHLEKNDVGSYEKLLPRYKSSIFQDFESFLRTEADLVDDNINLILDEYNSNFINYETPPGIYSIEDLSEVLSKIFELIVMITVIRN